MDHDHDHSHDHAHEGETAPVELTPESEPLEPAPVEEDVHDHGGIHDHEGESVWEHAWEIFSDPAHILAELGWTIIQDGLFIALLYGVVFKKLILPKLRKDIHREIDEEHGITH